MSSSSPGSASPTPMRGTQDAIRAGLDFLESRQEKDGAWRSQVYRDMASGYELTPMIAKALAFCRHDKAAQRGLAFVNAGLDRHEKFVYPVYTAADMLLAHSRLPDPPHQKAWTTFLLSYQLTAANGWSAQDPDFGGWGYSLKPPRKGQGNPMAHSNLTSTTFALGALSLKGLPASHPAVGAARSFVLRCQTEPGGFLAAPVIPGVTTMNDALNKAGPGIPYGSASADGVRALFRCGLGLREPTVQRATGWMVSHFDALKHSGDFPTTRYEDRDSLYFYYLWSTAHALSAMQRAGDRNDRSKLAKEITLQLLLLQQPDGSWRNSVGATREDEPLVATPMALAALALCQTLGGGR